MIWQRAARHSTLRDLITLMTECDQNSNKAHWLLISLSQQNPNEPSIKQQGDWRADASARTTDRREDDKGGRAGRVSDDYLFHVGLGEMHSQQIRMKDWLFHHERPSCSQGVGKIHTGDNTKLTETYYYPTLSHTCVSSVHTHYCSSLLNPGGQW